MVWRNVLPHNLSGVPGPGTLVITAVVFFENRPSTASCTGFTNKPVTLRMAKASSGW